MTRLIALATACMLASPALAENTSMEAGVTVIVFSKLCLRDPKLQKYAGDIAAFYIEKGWVASTDLEADKVNAAVSAGSLVQALTSDQDKLRSFCLEMAPIVDQLADEMKQ